MGRRIQNLREWLTLPSPSIDSTRLKEGSTPMRHGVVGPDKIDVWTDFRIESMADKLRDLLNKPYKFKADAIPTLEASLLKPTEEHGVRTDIHEKWNEPIVSKALKATTEMLREKDWAFSKGEVCFRTNTGEGHIPRERPSMEARRLVPWKPDWYCKQTIMERSSLSEEKVYLLYGETKPSGRFRSSWIHSDKKSLRMRAQRTLEQLTTYSVAQNLRHTFIMSDTEFVAIRLSKRLRNSASTVIQSSTETLSSQDALERIVIAHSSALSVKSRLMDVRQDKTTSPDDSYSEDSKIDVCLEYAAVDWGACGQGQLTFNLALWWLIMMATENRLMEGHELNEPSSNLASQEEIRASKQTDSQQDSIRTVENSQTCTNPALDEMTEVVPWRSLEAAGIRATRARTREQQATATRANGSVINHEESQSRKRQRVESSPQRAKAPRTNSNSFASQYSSVSRRADPDGFNEFDCDSDESDMLHSSFAGPTQNFMDSFTSSSGKGKMRTK